MTTDSSTTVSGLAQVLRKGRRDPYAREQTEPFLQQIGQAFVEKFPDIHTSPLAQRQRKLGVESDNIQFINNIYFEISEKVDYLGLRVSFWPTGVLWWGLYANKDEAHASKFAHLCRHYQLVPNGCQLHTGNGVYRDVLAWQGGAYCAVGRELSAEEIEAYPDVQSLLDDIVGDLVQLYQRIEPHLPSICKRLRIGQTTDRQTRSRVGGAPGESKLNSGDTRPALPVEAEIFLEELVKKVGQPEVDAAEAILRWAITETDGIRGDSEISPMLSIGSGPLLLFSLRANGRVRLLFTNYGTAVPFYTQEKLLALCDRLNKVSAINLSPADMARNITIPLSALVDEAERQQFTAAFSWMVQQVRAAAR